MAWEDEDDTTVYNKADYSVKIQKILTTIEKDPKLIAAVRTDAPKALAPYKLTAMEIKEVSKFFRR